MKRILSLSLAALAVLTLPALAQEGLEDPVLSTTLDTTPMTLETMDLDQDGVVTQEEFTSFHLERVQRYFASLDANGDAQLQSSELVQETEAREKARLQAIQKFIPDLELQRKKELMDSKPAAGTRGPSGPFSRRKG